MAPTNCHAESRGSCGVGVEGDHVSHVRAGREVSPTTSANRSVEPPRRSAVQLRELSPLALIAHPEPLPGIPAPRAMEEEEGAAVSVPVLLVQLLDLLPREPEERLVLRKRLLARVREVRQQAEVQMLVPIRQEPDLQRLDQILDVLRARDHRRDHDERARFRGNPRGEVHSRQQVRPGEQRGQPVHQGDRQLARAQQGEDSDQARASSRAGRRPAPSPSGRR